MKINELLNQIFDRRVEMILQKYVNEQRKRTQKEEAVLASFDNQVRSQIEDLLGDRDEAAIDEYRLIYKSGFLDGLRLGHKAF